jgi:aminoglycoside/choline kinase family phosphotransferase
MIAGDASNRRYFRLILGGNSYIVAEAPPATEKNVEFLSVRELLAETGVRVPEIFAADIQRGFILLEDLGDNTLLPFLKTDTVAGYYDSAFEILLKMAAVDLSKCALPAYGRNLLDEELSRFDQWFVEALLGHSLSSAERDLIAAFGKLLVGSALEQPRVIVHRDFHSRNLMLSGGDQLAVIDFQDAVAGPVTYDLASLLRDCYIRWPQDRVQEWALDYRRLLLPGGLLEGTDEAQFLRWFDWMGLQRHIKVLGTFARLYLRDGKTGYLDDLPLVIRYTREMLERYAVEEPVFARFRDWFEGVLVPLIDQQPWSAGS